MQGPNVNDFVSQWNIGFRGAQRTICALKQKITHFLCINERILHQYSTSIIDLYRKLRI